VSPSYTWLGPGLGYQPQQPVGPFQPPPEHPAGPSWPGAAAPQMPAGNLYVPPETIAAQLEGEAA
jgi:hypothetical protein